MGILDGIVEWIAEQVMHGLDLVSTSVLGALGCDMSVFLRYFPAAGTLYEVFLDCHFRWPDAVRIQIVDDSCVLYSFFFQEERLNGNGICGGIILHGQEDLKKACIWDAHLKNLIDSPAGLDYNKCEVICLLQSAVRFSHRGTKGGTTDG